MKTNMQMITSIIFTVILLTACSNKFTSTLQPDNKTSEIKLETAQRVDKKNHLRPCTLIGCFNTITILLPESLSNAPGEYVVEVGLNNIIKAVSRYHSWPQHTGMRTR